MAALEFRSPFIVHCIITKEKNHVQSSPIIDVSFVYYSKRMHGEGRIWGSGGNGLLFSRRLTWMLGHDIRVGVYQFPKPLMWVYFIGLSMD